MGKTLPEYGLHHVGYVVGDLDAALSAMKADLGDISFQMYDFKPSKAWCYGEAADNYHLKIAMITLAKHQTCIELIQPMCPGLHEDMLRQFQGVNHICFAVEGDYDQWRDSFAQSGAQFVFESETEDEAVGYRRCFYVRDGSGNIVEIKETPYFRK